ncbi:hypothetical protein WJU16_03610 [Chitinophaga pollutisoli]|uniref:Uncharacterized protein n=1 Tax=Chitinophaga pollutisoli TaxID=3133966 RepID=A0ABZ2YRF0_9BACT
MVLETFIATVKHDNGKIRIRVVSMNGEQGVIEQIMAAERCPQRAIVKIKKVGNNIKQ